MGARAFVMVSVEPARTQQIVEHLRTVKGATVYEVLGPFDVIVDLEAATQEEVMALLKGQIRSVRGVTGTLTCAVVQGGWETRGPGAQAGGVSGGPRPGS